MLGVSKIFEREEYFQNEVEQDEVLNLSWFERTHGSRIAFLRVDALTDATVSAAVKPHCFVQPASKSSENNNINRDEVIVK